MVLSLNEDKVGQAIYDFLRENNNVKRSDIFVGRIESNLEEIKLTDEQFEAMNSGRRKACAVCVNMKDTFGYNVFALFYFHSRACFQSRDVNMQLLRDLSKIFFSVKVTGNQLSGTISHRIGIFCSSYSSSTIGNLDDYGGKLCKHSSNKKEENFHIIFCKCLN